MARTDRRSMEAVAVKTYISIVELARQPMFYLECGVADTPDGRFDMVAVHAALLLRRLRRDQERTERLAQAVFDLMFADMDQNLREMGVGDLAVGKRIKRMAQGFYGRLAAYDKALADPSGDGLGEALVRNVYRHRPPSAGELAKLADYVRGFAAALDREATEALLAGDVQRAPARGDAMNDFETAGHDARGSGA